MIAAMMAFVRVRSPPADRRCGPARGGHGAAEIFISISGSLQQYVPSVRGQIWIAWLACAESSAHSALAPQPQTSAVSGDRADERLLT
jgi:hypothetical protein